MSLPAAPKLPGNAFSTLLNADAIEFVPREGLEDVFVCGTYQLKAGDEGLKVPHRCCARTIAHNAITRVRNFVTSCSPLVACAGQAEEQTRLGRLWVLEVVQVLPRPRPRGPFLLTFVLGAFMLAPVLAPLPPTPYTRSHLSPYGTLACGTRCRSKTMEGIQRVLGASALTNPPILGCEVCPRDCPLRTSAACRCWLLTVPYAFVCGSRDVCMRVRVWMCWPGPLIDCPGSEVLTRSLN